MTKLILLPRAVEPTSYPNELSNGLSQLASDVREKDSYGRLSIFLRKFRLKIDAELTYDKVRVAYHLEEVCV